MDKDTIKSKIKKLLALASDNPSEAESISALEKAQELMVQYKISENELEDENKEKCVHVATKFSYSSRSSDTYLNALAEIIAENFCCINYVSRRRGSTTRSVIFMGLEEDIKIAVEAMTLANMAIIRGYNRVYKDMCKKYEVDYVPTRYFNPAKEGYCDGYLKGLKEALDAQKEKNQEWGLVLVAPKEAQDFFNNLSTESLNTVRVSNTYYNDGYNDGKNFNMNKKLSGEGTKRIGG